MNLTNHPCFNDKVRHTFGRIHLPVAPRCNIQCKFCNRKYDCVNESRPGVTTGLLSPEQAMVYLDAVMAEKKNISVVGIAGPGDPFANPEETMETLRLVRRCYPEMLLCVATNGLNIAPYIDELAELKVSHVTVTINAIDPAIGEKVYSWVRFDKHVYHPIEGARILLEKQIKAVEELKKRNIVVKVNSIIIPGINDEHIPAVAEKMSQLGVDILNCLPYYPNDGAAFRDIPEPSKDLVKSIREKAAKFIPQMHHCTRCRADAVGLLGEGMSEKLQNMLKSAASIDPSSIISSSVSSSAVSSSSSADEESGISTSEERADERKYVAVASMEGFLVNQHLGEAYQLRIYGKNGGKNGDLIELVDTRPVPEPGGGNKRWEILSQIINDCSALMVSGIGENPKSVLTDRGIKVYEIEGMIEDALQEYFDGRNLRRLLKRKTTACGGGCSGGAMGCG